MRLPEPPSLQKLQDHTPGFAAVPPGTRRPFFSVMIPTYNSGDYLRTTLLSVLNQDFDPAEMHIEVVDGCSTRDDPRRVVKELGQGRVGFHSLPANGGPAVTLNACIERSRGQWVHLLHGDDVAMPGFYTAYADTIRAHPEACTVLGQVVIIDGEGRWLEVQGPQPAPGGGIFKDFVDRQLFDQQVMAPAVVARRDAYEREGGFCTLFRSVTDWDLYFRLGLLGSVAVVPRPYALYRRHGASETVRLMESAAHMEETYFVVQANLSRLHRARGTPEELAWNASWAGRSEGAAWAFSSQGSITGRYNHARWAWLLEPNARRLALLATSWLRQKFQSPGRSGPPHSAVRN